MEVIKKINKVTFINLQNLWTSLNGIIIPKRLSVLMQKTGVVFYDEKFTFISEPSVGIVGLGGFPILWTEDTPCDCICISNTNCTIKITEITNSFYNMFSYAAYQTYLNPNDLEPKQMINLIKDKNHFSVAHLGYINLMVSGMSISVENEFNTQRDLIHIARLTENRTACQSYPCIIVLYPQLLEIHQRVYEFVNDQVLGFYKPDELLKGDFLESINALYSASKGTTVILSSTIRNLQKLVLGLNDQGKENEYKRVLAKINDNLSLLFPDFFKPTLKYHFKYPNHWDNNE